MDYWAIALSSIALMRSVFPGSTRRTTALALAATPINPLAVSTVSAVAMEVHCASHFSWYYLKLALPRRG